MRIYDPRLGRFLSVDPLTNDFAFYSPYQFSGSKPVGKIDLDGAEEMPSTQQLVDLTKQYKNALDKVSDKDLKDKLGSAFAEATLHLGNFIMRDRKLSAYNMFRYLEGKGGYDVF